MRTEICQYSSICPEYRDYNMLCKWFSDECSIVTTRFIRERQVERRAFETSGARGLFPRLQFQDELSDLDGVWVG